MKLITRIVLCAALCWLCAFTARAADRPNVLFILVDDMGWKDLACYGHELHETPNIDQLAAAGMRFTNAYAACPICSPSRAAIMTGKFPSNTGFVDNYASELDGTTLQRAAESQFLDLKEVTLAEAFQAQGYQTAFVGKWHLSASDTERLPTDQGFDVNVAGCSMGAPKPNGYFSPYHIPESLLKDGPKGEYLTDRLTTEAIGMMDRFSQNERPWLLYMSYYTVHSPFEAKAEKVRKYQEKALQAKVVLKNPRYAGMVESLDENVGRLLTWLDEKGLREETIVVFTSDNGGHRPATNIDPLRSYKGDLYEGGIRVPCIIDWPGVIQPGSVSDVPVHGVDFYATLLAMAGLSPQPEHHQDSVNLVPLLKGKKRFERSPLFWHYPVGVPHIAHSKPGSVIREGDWKFLRFYEDGREELYNLKNDIGEKTNLVASMPEKAAELKAQLDTVLEKHNATIPAAVPVKPKRRAKKKGTATTPKPATVNRQPATAARSASSGQAPRPNILYIALEDITPMMGCYGDTYAKTPNFDQLAAEGIRYTNAHSVAPVCSVSRSSIVTGMYPSSIGTLHHRSGGVRAPKFLKFVPNLMREAGYYTTNQKGDFNIVGMKYDKSGKKGGDAAPWRSRPNENQPFFSKVDFGECHSSVTKTAEDVIVAARLNRLQPDDFHDPKKAPIPSYHPDDPLFRTAWARYYDAVTQVDYRTGEVIAALKEDGLWDDTIVIVWADHGVGMPRGKHTCWEQGTHVPLIVRFPEKYQHLAPAEPGAVVDDLVCLMDMAPSVLTLAGIDPPESMQGRALLCQGDAEKREFLVAMRNRLDTRTQFVRAVRDKRYRYMRHFFPHRPYAPYETYQWEAPIYDRFQELALAGKLEGPQAEYAQRFKAIEQLYDSENDPEMVHNLADDPAYADMLNTMRQRLHDWMVETRDLAIVEERVLYERAEGGSLWQVGQDLDNYERILETANLQLDGESAVPELVNRSRDDDPLVRYWATLGLAVVTQSAGAETVNGILPSLKQALTDSSLDVRLLAAEGLFNLGHYEEALPAVIAEMAHPNTDVQVRVGNILDSQPPDANEQLATAIEPLAIAKEKFKPQARYGSANKPFDRAYRALTGQQLYYRWGMGASGSPESPLMAVQKTPFTKAATSPPKLEERRRKPQLDQTSRLPNIIFIMADDLGYADVSCYGAEKIQTPNIDRIAEEGIRFTDGHAGASTCTPTRYGFMTGRYNFRSWLKYSALSTSAPLLIEEDRVTVPSFLKSKGYATSLIGKWHLGYGHEEGFEDNRGSTPPNQWETRGAGPDWNGELRPGPQENGFDYSYVIPVANSFPPYVIVENDRVEGLTKKSPIGALQSRNYGSMGGGEGARWTDEELIDKFANKLESELDRLAENDPSTGSASSPQAGSGQGAPFFLCYTPSHPHVGSRRVKQQAHWPHERFAGTSEAGPFGDVIHELDWSVGVILKKLEDLDIDDDTLVIFTSDNGGYPRPFNGHYPMGPILRGGKGDLVEGGTRVPFVAKWPGKIPAGTVSKEIVSTTDMMATFAAIVGEELPKGAGPDSYNVLPALLGNALPDPDRPIVFISGGTGALSLRAGKWKLIQGQGNRGYGEFRAKKPVPAPQPGSPPDQLYNLEEDLGEANNLYNQHPEIVTRLKKTLEQIKTANH